MWCPKENLHNDINSGYDNIDRGNLIMSHPQVRAAGKCWLLREGQSGFVNPLPTHRLSKTKQSALNTCLHHQS